MGQEISSFLLCEKAGYLALRRCESVRSNKKGAEMKSLRPSIFLYVNLFDIFGPFRFEIVEIIVRHAAFFCSINCRNIDLICSCTV